MSRPPRRLRIWEIRTTSSGNFDRKQSGRELAKPPRWLWRAILRETFDATGA